MGVQILGESGERGGPNLRGTGGEEVVRGTQYIIYNIQDMGHLKVFKCKIEAHLHSTVRFCNFL